ncbi:MAG: 3-carboxy-cis,cis-muconate cycloisomerase [Flavobacteriaceae bacterium]
MSLSLFDDPLFSGLVGDAEIAALFTPRAVLDAMLRFEAALAAAQAEAGLIDAASAAAVGRVVDDYRPDMAALARGVARDGLPVPALVAALREELPADMRKALHLATTSQDLIDTALALRLAGLFEILGERIAGLLARFDELDAAHGARRVMGVTRMREALEIGLGERIAAWRSPLADLAGRLEGLRNDVCVVHLRGPVGDCRDLGEDPAALAAAVGGRLGLGHDPARRHSDRGWVADTGHWLTRLAGALGKFGQDVALMAQDGVGQVRLTEGGSSSAMAHKKNPVAAETLVALARFTAVQNGGLSQCLVHEMERSGAAWTLEWMILPQMAAAAGAATLLAGRVLDTTDFSGAAD